MNLDEAIEHLSDESIDFELKWISGISKQQLVEWMQELSDRRRREVRDSVVE